MPSGTGPNSTPPSDSESKWADHLFNEWKYRHENFWRTLYRYLAALAVLVTVPFVQNEYFKPMAKGFGMGVYISLPVIVFIVLCFVLTREHAKLAGVEQKLASVRKMGGYKPETEKALKTLWNRKCVAAPFIVIGSGLLACWIIILVKMPSVSSSSPKASTPGSCITISQ